jgi:plasmid stability protein
VLQVLRVDTTIRNLDEHTYREFRARAVQQGRNVGELLNEAMRAYLVRATVSQGRSTLRTLKPESFPAGNELLSQEIDAIVYGERQQ